MKKIIFIATSAAILSVSGYLGIKMLSFGSDLTDLQLENVEALVGGEDGGRYKCYSSTHYKEGASVIKCDTCESEYNQTDNLFCFHDWCYR